MEEDTDPLAPLRTEGRHEELLEALVARLDAVKDPRPRALHFLEIAGIFRDKMGDAAQAFDAMLEAWSADPTLEATLEPLETLTRAQGRWSEVIEEATALGAKERDRTRALAIYETMVRWLTREVPAPELARQYLERIRSLDATHWTLHLFQAAVYREHGDLKRELEDLDRAVLSARRVDDRVRIHLLMASRYTEARTLNWPEAKKHYESARVLMPRSMDALRGLENVAVQTEDHAGLAETLARQADASDDNDEKVTILMRLSELHEKRFLKPDVAAEILERVLSIAPLNTQALASLERCYFATRNWNELLTAFERSVVMNDEPTAQAARLRTIAEVHESKLSDLASARWAYERLSELMPDDAPAAAELARICEKLGDVDATVKHKTRLAELTLDPTARARAHLALGQLLSANERDPKGAREHLEKAATLDPTLEAAWNALNWSAKNAGDDARVAMYLEQRASTADGPRLRGQLFGELAEMRARLGDDAGAIAAYEEAHEADPENEKAAQALVPLYVAAERWEEAAKLHEVAFGAAERDRDGERRFALFLLGSQIASARGDLEGSLTSAMRAFELRANATEAQMAVISAAAALSPEPSTILRAKDALEAIGKNPVELPADWLASLADLLALCGETKSAYALYDAALAAEPSQRAALTGLARLSEHEKDVVVATALRRRLADTLEDADEKYAMLVDSGDSLANAGKMELAVQAYEEARAVRPTARKLLHVLLEHYTKLEDWAKLSSVLRSIIDTDDDPARKAKVASTMAQLAQDHLKDNAAAVKLAEEALDLDPTRLEAFERIVTIRTTARDWQALERDYRRLIHRTRAGGDAKLQHALFHQLGLVYRDRLRDRPKAIEAFRAAAELVPEDGAVQSILRELLEVTGNVGDAISVSQDRLFKDPTQTEAYGPLVDLWIQTGDLDRAWCAASNMEQLGVLGEKHAGFYREHTPIPLAQIGGALDPDAWRGLLHRELDPRLTEIFEIVAPAAVDIEVARLTLMQRVSYPGKALTRAPGSVVIAEAIERAATLFGMKPPRLYASNVGGAPISVARTRPPGLFVSADAQLAIPFEQIAFTVGKRVFELAPPLLARALFPTVTELTAVVSLAVNATMGTHRSDPLRGHLKGPEMERLGQLIGGVRAAGGELDIKRWTQLADLSSSRAGLLLAGDMTRARAALQRGQQLPGDLPMRDQLRDLLAFMLSDPHASLRRALGIALRPGMRV